MFLSRPAIPARDAPRMYTFVKGFQVGRGFEVLFLHGIVVVGERSRGLIGLRGAIGQTVHRIIGSNVGDFFRLFLIEIRIWVGGCKIKI